MSMPGRGEGVSFNVRLRTDARPEQLLKEIALSPLIYIRLLGMLFSIIVFGCVADQVLLTNGGGIEVCYYSGNYSACSFAIAVGVIGFLLCLAFIVKDILIVVIDYSDSPVIKKVILLVDIGANAFWGFMWFVCFCFTANQLNPIPSSLTLSTRNCANSGVAFSFFSILAWGAIVGINVVYFILLMKRGDVRGVPGSGGPSGYASFPEGQSDGGNEDHRSQYAPPEY